MDFRAAAAEASLNRWSAELAWSWHQKMPWLVGCNYTPAYAINQLEMWQADTFDLPAIDRELGWLADLGFNSLRVFLHDLLWVQDAAGFLDRLEQFLEVANNQGLGVVFVFFDSVWHPFPRPGRQREPERGVHNSGWLQSPGLTILKDEKAGAHLEDYVKAVVSRFRDDERVHVWDIWNEPDNDNRLSYGPRDLPAAQKAGIVAPLLVQAFRWVREERARQPLTSGIWAEEWMKNPTEDGLPWLQVQASDVISFHRYAPIEMTRQTVDQLKKLGRPLLCTEYLARTAQSTFEDHLPFFRKEKIGAFNWGGVVGKTQTHFPWDSWQQPYEGEPALWLHDILRADGTAYRESEVELIRKMSGRLGPP